MEKLQLKATVRDIKAQNPSQIRAAGNIPAVLYGHNIPNLHLILNQNEFEKILRKAGENTIVEIITDDGKPHNVLINDVQKHYLTSKPDHADFYEVSMTEKLTAPVPLEFVGESNAVKAMGGTLVKQITEVEVECLPSDLPRNIEVDISLLKTFEDSILVKDLKLPANVEIVTDAEELVSKVSAPRDVEAELAEPVVEDISKVEGAAEDKPEAVAEGEEEKK